MNCLEYGEIIAAHVDGALSPEEGIAAQSHLNKCPRCQQNFLWETEVKRSLRQRLSLIPARPGLRARVLDQLGETAKEGFFGWYYMRYGLVAAFALLFIVAVPYLVWRGKVEENIFSDAISQYQRVTQGIADTAQADRSQTPAARLLDLSPWGYRVLAKQSQQVRGQEGRVFVYQSQGKEYLLAQEFDEMDFSPPSGARVIQASSREFVSYSQEGINLIAFKEKDLLCILASTLPREKLLGLAQQIAMGS